MKLRKNLILTVGAGNNWQRIKIKGIDFFCELAKSLPEYKFLIIGLNDQAMKLLGKIPENLEIIGKVPQEKLLYYYQRAKIYAQFFYARRFAECCL